MDHTYIGYVHLSLFHICDTLVHLTSWDRDLVSSSESVGLRVRATIRPFFLKFSTLSNFALDYGRDLGCYLLRDTKSDSTSVLESVGSCDCLGESERHRLISA